MSFLCYLYLLWSRVGFVLFVFVGARVVFVFFGFVKGWCRFFVICICRGLVSLLCYLYL
jgi:hypothetical protein